MIRHQSRLIFALDATASRSPTWDKARELHAEIFSAAVDTESLAVQLCHYRGLFDFQVSPWITQAGALLDHMTAVRCEAGGTQILRVLAHAIAAGTTTNPIRALVFIGDACEESTESLLQLAGQCAIMKLPVFIFHEGHDHRAGTIFRQIADLSRGAYAPFDASSADQLRLLLGAVSRYARGGIKALLESNADGDKILIEQLRRF